MNPEPELFTTETIVDKFHNTTGLSGDDLKAHEMKADSQGRVILNFFRHYPTADFTPADVYRMLRLRGVPITSIRRSITNLCQCKEHYLIKTRNKRPGLYGKNHVNFAWRLNPDADQTTYTQTFEYDLGNILRAN